MITQDNETKNCLCINQQTHANLSKQLAEKITIPLDKKIQQNLLEACQHHDDGWSKSDKRVLMNKKLNRPYTFLSIPSKHHLYIWKKTLAYNNQKPTLTQYFICYHLKYLAEFYEQKKTQNNITKKLISNFISNCLLQLKKLKKDIKSNHISDIELKKCISILQFCDELSLRICMDSKQTVTRFLCNNPIKIYRLSRYVYGLTPYPFCEKLTLKINAFHNKNLKKRTLLYTLKES